ncbi:aldo/keto reductase [Fluviicola sp. SGL-29]|nr:aldo/keto reductase [Fluviicola sp. SGL-29]
MRNFKLHNDIEMPAIGFGTYKLAEGKECYESVKFALENNYRHLDTAAVYENESSVGEAVRASGTPREELFITTKVWNSDRGYEATLKAFEASVSRLGLDYIDLYLVHWPANTKHFGNAKELNAETWRAMEYLYTNGKVRAIGVSNFLAHHLEELLETAMIVPMVNQIEYHPGYLQQETVDFCNRHKIIVEAWSPLGRGRVLEDAVLMRLADKYNVSTGAICLQFALQQGICVLPKSATPSRIIENYTINFELEPQDIEAIKKMPETGFSGLHPDEVGF